MFDLKSTFISMRYSFPLCDSSPSFVLHYIAMKLQFVEDNFIPFYNDGINEALPGVLVNRGIGSFISMEQGKKSLKMKEQRKNAILGNREQRKSSF